jgi:NADPH:quinone reductase-like Zn-dependent oxidoreductase
MCPRSGRRAVLAGQPRPGCPASRLACSRWAERRGKGPWSSAHGADDVDVEGPGCEGSVAANTGCLVDPEVDTVRAIVQDRYGEPADVLRLAEVDDPVPGSGEVLVRVRAASVHPDVWHVVTGRPLVLRAMGAGLRRPRPGIPGTDMAGTVTALGPGTSGFEPGDEVFGETLTGYQWKHGGTFAEYVAVRAGALRRRPAPLTAEQAATVPTSGFIALHNMRAAGRGGPGRRVLVNGAGGGVGMIAVQLAKAGGAHVTAVDTAAKRELLLGLGADEAVDHQHEDATRSGRRYDLVFDVVGSHPVAQWRRVLEPSGVYVLIGHDRFGAAGHRVLGSIPRFLGLAARARFVPQLRTTRVRRDTAEFLGTLAGLAERGQLTPVVDRTFPLAEAADAIAYLATGRARGRVVVTV